MNSAEKRSRPLTDDEIDLFVNYGSDDENDEELRYEDDELLISNFIPRAARMFFDDEEEEDCPTEPTLTEASTADAESQFSANGEAILTPHGPEDLFSFSWKCFPSSLEPAEKRREPFRAEKVGPSMEFSSPYEAFTAIWTPALMEMIANQTNKYAQQTTERRIREGCFGPNSRLIHWKDTNVNELYVYFAILLATGINIKSDLNEYWTKEEISHSPFFPRYMSYSRFLLLSACLHFTDNTRTNLQTMTIQNARLAKIQPIVDHLNEKFETLYHLNQNIALDESLTQWKGWLSFKQFIKIKAASVGVKTYEVCESSTGYLWRFKVYTGQGEQSTSSACPLSGFIPALVLDLLKGLEDKGHTVWMDNFYNSPGLARILKTRGFDCVGTLRTNRQGVPPQIKKLTKKDMESGQISGCTSGDVDIVVWKDANRVAMISTYHGAGIHTARGETKPTVVYDYNVRMGGVDKKDQMLSMYPIERKRTKIWYKKFFKRLLNASTLNSFILYRDSATDAESRIRHHRQFRKTLIAEIVAKHATPLARQTPLPLDPKPKLQPEMLMHFPAQYGFLPNPTKNERMRRSCVLCHKRVSTYCPACDVPLCFDECIKKYHS